MTEVEVGGVKFKGGKAFAIIMALGSMVGALYGGFEVYKDYMDMKEQIQEYVAPDLWLSKRRSQWQKKPSRLRTLR